MTLHDGKYSRIAAIVRPLLICCTSVLFGCVDDAINSPASTTQLNEISTAQIIEMIGSTCDGKTDSIIQEFDDANSTFIEGTFFALGEEGAPYNNVAYYRTDVSEFKIILSYVDSRTQENCLFALRANGSSSIGYRAAYPTDRSAQLISANIANAIDLALQRCNRMNLADRGKFFRGGGLRRTPSGEIESTGTNIIAPCDRLIKNNISSIVFSLDWGEVRVTLVSDKVFIERI